MRAGHAASRGLDHELLFLEAHRVQVGPASRELRQGAHRRDHRHNIQEDRDRPHVAPVEANSAVATNDAEGTADHPIWWAMPGTAVTYRDHLSA